jgi:uncharacterized protein YdeI (YjbR/CyaY-like superfamily)
MKLNLQQKDYLKGLTSKKKRKTKIEFRIAKREKTRKSKLFIDDLINVISNPLFLK